MRTNFLRRFFSVALLTITMGVANADDKPCTEIKMSADALGPAKGFNLYVLENVDHRTTDTEGRVAVGGDAVFNHYELGRKASVPKVKGVMEYIPSLGKYVEVIRKEHVKAENATLIVGGRFYQGFGTFHGIAIVGSWNFPPSEVGHVTGGIYQNQVVAFNDSSTYLKGLSTHLSKLETKVSETKVEGSAILLKGVDPKFNLFRVSGRDLALATYLRVEVPAGATALVNIDGKSTSLVKFGFDIVGTNKEKVLLNFFEAERVILRSIGYKGSMLAPLADVGFDDGLFEGTMIVKSMAGTGQINQNLFEGELPVKCKCECKPVFP